MNTWESDFHEGIGGAIQVMLLSASCYSSPD